MSSNPKTPADLTDRIRDQWYRRLKPAHHRQAYCTMRKAESRLVRRLEIASLARAPKRLPCPQATPRTSNSPDKINNQPGSMRKMADGKRCVRICVRATNKVGCLGSTGAAATATATMIVRAWMSEVIIKRTMRGLDGHSGLWRVIGASPDHKC